MIISESMQRSLKNRGNDELLNKILESSRISDLGKEERRELAKETARFATVSSELGGKTILPVVTTLSPLAEAYLRGSLDELSKDYSDEETKDTQREKAKNLTTQERVRRFGEIDAYVANANKQGTVEDTLAAARTRARSKEYDKNPDLNLLGKIQSRMLSSAKEYQKNGEYHIVRTDDADAQSRFLINEMDSSEEQVELKAVTDEYLAKKLLRFGGFGSKDALTAEEEKNLEAEEDRQSRYPEREYERGEKEREHEYYG